MMFLSVSFSGPVSAGPLVFMSDPFDSSRRRIARAKEHITDLEQKIAGFTAFNPYVQVTEAHPHKPDHVVHKIKMSEPLPNFIGDIVHDVVVNLRDALDNAGYAIAVASGRSNPKFTAFPFAGSVAQMANALGRSKDIPQQIQSLFCGFQPYRGGNDLFWALNEICVGEKHKMVTPVGQGFVRVGASAQARGYFEMPDPHIWDRVKNEMVLITFGPDTKFQYDFDFRFFIAFNDVQIVDGQPVLGVLRALCDMTERVFFGIEAESKRLGIVK
jgi:hypothetical protein